MQDFVCLALIATEYADNVRFRCRDPAGESLQADQDNTSETS